MTLALSTAPLTLGRHEIWPPVVLAPMAGITNVAFRNLCREQGGGVYVCEMITTRALVERIPKTLKMIEFGPDEKLRSLQLYGVDPEVTARAVRMVAEEGWADHIDLNFGCPVPKVTRRGGGSALPWRRKLFGRIVKQAVEAAAPAGIPLTIKMRKGIDDDHLTYLDAGRIAEDAGIAAVTLHARTCAQHYSGQADWAAIGKLKEHVTSIPVLGNGDIFDGDDAVRMMRETGCDGVVVGRGVLGKPWLFGELQQALTGTGPGRLEPRLEYVAQAFLRHAQLSADFLGDEGHACRDIRKHVAWYFKGYSVGGELRASLATVKDLAQLDELLAQLDWEQPYPGADAEGQRGRAGTPKSPSLPQGWLDSRELQETHRAELTEAELSTSGG